MGQKVPMPEKFNQKRSRIFRMSVVGFEVIAFRKNVGVWNATIVLLCRACCTFMYF